MNFAPNTTTFTPAIEVAPPETMDFRASLVDFLERHNDLARINKKITPDMKVTFVNFMNDVFAKHHRTDNVEYLMNSNIMMANAAADDEPLVRVLIVADETLEYHIPGANTPRRAEVEAYVLVGDNICYDSVSMSIFKKREVTTTTTKYVWNS